MKRWKRQSDRSGRAALRSPGRPTIANREQMRRFWAAISAGLVSEEAAATAGVPQAVGARWFRKAGGMRPAMFGPSAQPRSGRYLSLPEREEIALLRAQGCTIREMGRRIQRAASTVSRELRRNAATRSGGMTYRATTAQWHAERSACRPKQAKLMRNKALHSYVQDRLSGIIMTPNGVPVAGPAVSWNGKIKSGKTIFGTPKACGFTKRLRAYPGSLDSWRGICGKSPEHDTDHGEAEECSNGRCVAFEVASQATVTTDPRERSFDDPPFG